MNTEPTVAPSKRKTQTMLEEAASHLKQAEAILEAKTPDFETASTHSREAIYGALRAFLYWHTIPYDESTPLHHLIRHATSISSALVTSTHIAPNFIKGAVGAQEMGHMNVTNDEEITAGYYTARNILITILGELPDDLTPPQFTPMHPIDLRDTGAVLNYVQAARSRPPS